VTAIYRQLQEAAEDHDLRVLVLRGQGADFCAGADIKAYNAGDANEPIARPARATQSYEVSLLLHEMPVFTIAAVKGACAGAGFGWAMACDMRIAAPSAVFNTAFLDVAVAGDMGGPWLLPRIVGAARARDLYFFPRKVRGEEAQTIGLVDRLFAEGDFETELAALTARLNGAAPLALAGLKRNFVEAERMDLRSYIELESLRHAQLFATRDREEAFRAFVDKRAPRFSGH
jgi:2-(1,2-epoxy-1,2-dihydrophenyl)acetyl-CoA isomerase